MSVGSTFSKIANDHKLWNKVNWNWNYSCLSFGWHWYWNVERFSGRKIPIFGWIKKNHLLSLFHYKFPRFETGSNNAHQISKANPLYILDPKFEKSIKVILIDFYVQICISNMIHVSSWEFRYILIDIQIKLQMLTIIEKLSFLINQRLLDFLYGLLSSWIDSE